jgi:hypothetical protein
MFRFRLFDHPQGAICRALCRYYKVFRWFAFVEYLHGMWLYVCIICLCVCLVLLSVEDLFVNCSETELPLTRAPSTHTNRWYTHTAKNHVNIQRRKSAEDIITAQSTAYGPLRMVECKGPKHVGVICVYKHVFNILVFLNVKMSVF